MGFRNNACDGQMDIMMFYLDPVAKEDLLGMLIKQVRPSVLSEIDCLGSRVCPHTRWHPTQNTLHPVTGRSKDFKTCRLNLKHPLVGHLSSIVPMRSLGFSFCLILLLSHSHSQMLNTKAHFLTNILHFNQILPSGEFILLHFFFFQSFVPPRTTTTPSQNLYIHSYFCMKYSLIYLVDIQAQSKDLKEEGRGEGIL